jgi:hypothetical protein
VKAAGIERSRRAANSQIGWGLWRVPDVRRRSASIRVGPVLQGSGRSLSTTRRPGRLTGRLDIAGRDQLRAASTTGTLEEPTGAFNTETQSLHRGVSPSTLSDRLSILSRSANRRRGSRKLR